jgi:Tfp pilus assembly protein PilN
MVDMHKEIKLADLFKRGSKDSGDAQNGNEPQPPKKVKPPKEPKRQKEPKRRKEPKQKSPKAAALTVHEAPPPADVPLMRAFNLLPREDARTVKEGAPSPLPYVLVALTGVLLFAALAAFYLMAGTDVTTKKGKIEDLRAELAAYQASAQQPSLDDKSAALANERVGRTNALASALAKRLAWDRLLREVALVVPDEVSLSQIQGNSPAAATATLTADGSPVTNLTIIGTTADQASVAEFMARLSVIRQLVAVRLKEAGESPNDPTRVVFTITGTLRLGS